PASTAPKSPAADRVEPSPSSATPAIAPIRRSPRSCPNTKRARGESPRPSPAQARERGKRGRGGRDGLFAQVRIRISLLSFRVANDNKTLAYYHLFIKLIIISN